MTSQDTNLELNDIQGPVLRVYRLPVARFFLLRIVDGPMARRWLMSAANRLTTVAEYDRQPGPTFNLGFTHPGLAALGLAPDTLASFPGEFRDGIASRAARLGDSGDSHPDHWESPMGTDDVHAMVMSYAPDETGREGMTSDFLASLRDAGGLTVRHVQDGALLRDGEGKVMLREHFGYRDGIGQPAIEGSGQDPLPGQGKLDANGTWGSLKPGEFVLGYTDEAGQVAEIPRPSILRRNGSYLVYRKLHQDVAAFRGFLRTNSDSPDAEELLAAKLMGRWRSGAPITLAKDRDDPTLAGDPLSNNNFHYGDDLKGLACPVGAHIRRMNPRAGLQDGDDHAVHRHRVLRRGLPYGPPLPEGADEDGVDRGALILMINASIERQFEFVQHVWANDGDFAGLSSEKDAILGDNDGTNSFTIPRQGVRRRVRGIPRFVRVRGGGYFFLPGIRALKAIAGENVVED